MWAGGVVGARVKFSVPRDFSLGLSLVALPVCGGGGARARPGATNFGILFSEFRHGTFTEQ